MKTSIQKLLKTPFLALGLMAGLAAGSHAAVTAGGTVGDTAILTEAGGGETLTRATSEPGFGPILTHDFDTSTVDGSYELTAPDTIRLSAGRHLVIHNSRWDGPNGGNRNEILSNLELAGADLAIGQAQDYIRNTSGADECVVTGGAIITVANDDDPLQLESKRSDDNGTGTTNSTRVANGTHMQLLKLDDSWDFLSVQRNANGATIGGTYTGVQYEVENPDTQKGSAFSFTAPSDTITLNETGLYIIFANTGFEKPNNQTRTSYLQRITVGGAEVQGSVVHTYIRGDANGNGANTGIASNGQLLNVTAAGALKVEVRKETGTDSVIQGGLTALTIIKLPAGAETIFLTDTTQQEFNGTSANPIEFANQVGTPNNPPFAHTGGSNTVTVNETGCYLFFGSHWTNSDAANDNHDRTVPLQRFRIDGANVQRGATSSYNRDGGQKTAGDWGGLLAGFAPSTTLQLDAQRIGHSDTGMTATNAALQGLSITSLIPTPKIVFNENQSVIVNTAGIAIPTTSLGTGDGNDPAGSLTYTVTSAPAGIDLKLSGGSIGMGATFTQAQVDAGALTFDALGTATSTGGFTFTVDDSAGNGDGSTGGTFVVEVLSPLATVTIASDGDVDEGVIAGFTITSDLAPGAGGIDVNFTYSGTAADGSDYTQQAMVNIASGATTADLDLTTFKDGTREGDESIVVTIDSLSATSVTPVTGSPSSATLTLLDINAAPVATNLTHVVSGTGTVDLQDIVVRDPDDFDAEYTTGSTPEFSWEAATSTTTFGGLYAGRAASGNSFDLDAGNPALVEANGFSCDLVFIPQAADLSGTVQVWEIGGTSNGSGVYLVDGIPHLLCKANGGGGDAPTDGGDPGFVDLNWEPDDTIVVPLSATPLTADLHTEIALAFDINGDTVMYSVNGAASATANLSAQSGLNFRGDHSVRIGTGAGTGSGGTTSAAGNTFNTGNISNVAGGSPAISELRFWNEATGTVGPPAGLVPDDITVTVDVDTPANGTLTATAGAGSAIVTGSGTASMTITGTAADVTAALATLAFVDNAMTTAIETITVTVDDGDEDMGGTLNGTIVVTATAPTTIYVDDDFSGSLGDPIADADGGTPVAPATYGIDAFPTIAEGLAAAAGGVPVVINDGDYTGENVALTTTDSIKITDEVGAETVQIGDLSAAATCSIELQGSNTLEFGTGTGTTISCAITGTGNLTKNGGGTVALLADSTFTGDTTISAGILDLGNGTTNGSLDGDIVNNATLVFRPAQNTTITQPGQITGTGLVQTRNSGAVEFTFAGANTFSGGFEFGTGSGTTWTGNLDGTGGGGARNGFVVFNHGDHLGTATALSEGGQLRAGTPGLTLNTNIDVTQGGFRCGGTIDFTLGGAINATGSNRGYGCYGIDAPHLTISGSIDLTGLDPGQAVIFQGTNNGDNGSWTVSGNITGTNGRIEIDTAFDDGEVTFTGTNSYTGTTTVEADGNFINNATYSGGGTHTVLSGGTMSGSGDLGGAALNVNTGGTLIPGTSPGTMQTGNLTIAGTLVVEVDNLSGTGHDKLEVTGTVDLTGATLDLVLASGLTGPGTVTLIDNDDGGDPVTSNFTGFPEGAVDAGDNGFVGNITYLGGGGDTNDVELTFTNTTNLGQWRLDNYGSRTNSGAGADTANGSNGRPNIENFAFGFDEAGNGHAGGGLTLIDDTGGSGNFFLQYPRRQDYGSEGVTIVDEFNRDLSATGWDAISTGLFVETTISSTATNGVNVDIIRVPLPASLPTTGGKARQGRLQITGP